MGGFAVRPKVLQYLSGCRGLVTSEQIVKAIGVTPAQVTDVMGALVRNNLLPGLTVVSPGKAWNYADSAEPAAASTVVAPGVMPAVEVTLDSRASAPARRRRIQVPEYKAGDVFEVVGRNTDGEPVLRSADDGLLYRAVPL